MLTEPLSFRSASGDHWFDSRLHQSTCRPMKSDLGAMHSKWACQNFQEHSQRNRPTSMNRLSNEAMKMCLTSWVILILESPSNYILLTAWITGPAIGFQSQPVLSVIHRLYCLLVVYFCSNRKKQHLTSRQIVVDMYGQVVFSNITLSPHQELKFWRKSFNRIDQILQPHIIVYFSNFG